jgi:3-oxoacyl-[acyl-carrier protein] reductase
LAILGPDHTSYSMNIQLTGKHALVCGGSRGIGKSSAMVLASLGAKVTLLARNPEHLFETAAALPKPEGQKHQWIVADTSDVEDLQQKIKKLIEKSPVHILVNNSGGPAGGAILSARPEDFVKAMQQHLLAAHTLTGLVVPGMKKTGYGRIVNIISTSVKIPLKGLGVSNTTRGAMASWAKTLSNELAPFGITVNNVLPGATSTDRLNEIITAKSDKLMVDKDMVIQEMKEEIPMGRFGTPEEIAQSVAFLASPAAAYITGVSLAVDGGRTGCL